MHAGFRYSPVLEVLIIFHPKLIKRLEKVEGDVGTYGSWYILFKVGGRGVGQRISIFSISWIKINCMEVFVGRIPGD